MSVDHAMPANEFVVAEVDWSPEDRTREFVDVPIAGSLAKCGFSLGMTRPF
ncbi:MAG: hypothetical protein JW888_14560 [Pirellulales bacterium]|nr:hypothetical protein [Pirellulales bacterium]